MYKAKNERYEIYIEESLDAEHKGIVIDVIAEPVKKKEAGQPFPEGMFGLVFMSEDKTTMTDKIGGHTIWGYKQFKNMDNLKLAQIGLELIQQALMREEEEENE